MKLIWTCELDETGLIRQNAEVVNTGEGQLEVGKIELAFTVPADANEILTTTRPPSARTLPQRQDFTLGRFAKASMAGRQTSMPPCAQRRRKRLRLHARQRLLRTRGMER